MRRDASMSSATSPAVILAAWAREIEDRVGTVAFEQGYHPEFLGEYIEQQKARNRLLSLSALSILGIFLVLHTDFRSAQLTFLVFLSLPFALVGGVLAVALGGGVVSLGAIVGFVTVLGIAGRNGIMLISHYPASTAGGGPALRPRAGTPRRGGAPCADLDDRADHDAGPAADRRRWQTGPVTRSSTRWRW